MHLQRFYNSNHIQIFESILTLNSFFQKRNRLLHILSQENHNINKQTLHCGTSNNKLHQDSFERHSVLIGYTCIGYNICDEATQAP
mgnify:FL=1